jgi:hypothetical protein
MWGNIRRFLMDKLKILALASALSITTTIAMGQAVKNSSSTSPGSDNNLPASNAGSSRPAETTGVRRQSTQDENLKSITGSDAFARASRRDRLSSRKGMRIRYTEIAFLNLPNSRVKMKTPDGPGTGGSSREGNTGAANKLNQ